MNLSNAMLIEKLKLLVKEERRITTEVLRHLREVERRMLYAELGYSSLIQYCIRELQYSESAAYRRVQAMRMMREVPEVAEKLEQGSLNLSTVAQASSFCRQTNEDKREVLAAIENKSSREAEKTLAERQPERKKSKDSKRRLKGGATKVTLVLEPELAAKVQELEEITGKKLKGLLEQLIDKELQRYRKRKATPTGKNSVYTKRLLRDRAGGQCQYVSPLGQRCTERHHLQIEHRQPRAKGGTDAIENLELLCPTHNRLRAVQHYGKRKMREFIPSLA